MRYFVVIVAFFHCSFALSQARTIPCAQKIDDTASIPVIEKGIGCEERHVKEISCETIEVDAQVKDVRHWLNYLAKNLLLDPLAPDTIPGGNYKIIAWFIIDKEGCITDVKVQNDPGFGLGEKVIKMISRYDINWYPATRNGRNVKAYKKQVVTIVVEREKCKLQEEVRELIL